MVALVALRAPLPEADGQTAPPTALPQVQAIPVKPVGDASASLAPLASEGPALATRRV